MKFFYGIVVLFSLVGFPAHSFFPEFEHHTRNDQREINSPRLFDGEYNSDRLTYELPIQWMSQWLYNPNVFQYGAGSLGPTRFLTRGRMKLQKDLGHGLEFRFYYLDRGDYEAHKNALAFEFYYQPLNWLGLSLYGEPSSLKKDDNVGVAATLLSSPNNTLRIYNTWVHFSHNKRSEDNTLYEKQPMSSGLVWRWLNPDVGSLSELSYRYDHDTQLDNSATGDAYTFGWHRLQWVGRFSLTEEKLDYLQIRVESEKGYEGDTLNTDNGINRWETERQTLWIQHQGIGRWIDLYGIRYAYQEWNASQGKVTHSDLIPHAWVPFYFGQSGTTKHQLHGGYEFTWHRGHGPQNLRSQLDKNNNLEHRGNIRYQLQFKQTTFMNFLLTMDLDQFGTGETWEGGSIQFTSVF